MSYVEEMFGLSGKTVVLTGGGGVLAGAMSKAYLGAGANVSLWDIKKEFADAAVQRLTDETGAAAGRLQAVEVDATGEENVAAAIAETEKQFGGIDVLVNAAGGNRGKSDFVDSDMETFEFVLKLNLKIGRASCRERVCHRV